jgi:hypothetical protein
MSFTKQYAFDPNNYIFDSDLIEFTESQKPRLKLSNNPGQDFVEDFADDTGHVYDSNAAEFVGGKYQQKNKRPTDGIFYSKFNIDINGNWGEDVLTGTAFGGASIADNALDLNYDDQRYVEFPGGNNGFGNQGTIEFEIKPNWSGRPVNRQMFFNNADGASTNHRITLVQYEATAGGVPGRLRLDIYNDTGVLIAGGYLSEWSPVAGTWYNFSVNVDCIGGTHRLFIDGVLFDSISGTGTRTSPSDIHVGAIDHVANFSIRNFIVYNSVQHTSNYTPDWSNIYEFDYIEGYDILPEMEYTGAGTLISFDSLTYTLTGSAKIALQIGKSGVWSYWNGATWATGDGTKDYMCSFSDFAANVGTLDIEGEIYGQFKIYFPDSNSQGDIDILTASLTAQIYSTANPSIEFKETITHEGLESFIETSTKTGSDEIKYILKKGSTNYYYDTVNEEWAESDGTYSQANTAVEIETNKATFTTIGVIMTIIAFLHSDDGTTTPLLTQVDVNYDFYSFDDTDTTKCLVYGWVKDENENPVENATVTAVPSVLKAIYGNNVNAQEQKSDTTDSNGYWEIELLESVTNGVYYTFYFYYDNHTEAFEKLVPNETSKKFGELEDIS